MPVLQSDAPSLQSTKRLGYPSIHKQKEITMTNIAILALAAILPITSYNWTPVPEKPVEEHLEASTPYENFIEYYIICDGKQYQYMVDLTGPTKLPTCQNILK